MNEYLLSLGSDLVVAGSFTFLVAVFGVLSRKVIVPKHQ